SLSGGEMLIDDTYQACGYVVGISNLSVESDQYSESDISRKVLSTLISAEHDGEIELGTSRFTVVPQSFSQRQLKLKFAFPSCRRGSFNELTEIEQFGRSSIL